MRLILGLVYLLLGSCALAAEERWKPTSNEILAGIRGDTDNLINREPSYLISPTEELFRRLHTLDLSGDSKDLLEACSRVRSIDQALESEIIALIEALWTRLPESQVSFFANEINLMEGNPASRYTETVYHFDYAEWVGVESEDTKAVEIVGRRLQQVSHYIAQYQSLTSILCRDGAHMHVQGWAVTAIGEVVSTLAASLAPFSPVSPLPSNGFLQSDKPSVVSSSSSWLPLITHEVRENVVSDGYLLSASSNWSHLTAEHASNFATSTWPPILGNTAADTESGYFAVFQHPIGFYDDGRVQPTPDTIPNSSLLYRLSKGRTLSLHLGMVLASESMLNLRDVQFHHITMNNTILEYMDMYDCNVASVFINSSRVGHFTITTGAISSLQIHDSSISHISSHSDTHAIPPRIDDLYINGNLAHHIAIEHENGDLDWQTTGLTLNIPNLRGTRIDIHQSELEDLNLTNSHLSRDITIENSRLRGSINLDNASMDDLRIGSIEGIIAKSQLTLRASHIRGDLEIIGAHDDDGEMGSPAVLNSIDGRAAEIGETVILSNVELEQGLFLNESTMLSLEISNLSGHTEGSGTPIRMWAARVRAEISIKDSHLSEVWLARSESAGLRISRTTVLGEVNVWGGKHGRSFIRGLKAKSFHAWYLEGYGMEFSSDDDSLLPSEIERMYLNHASINHVYISYSKINQLHGRDLRSQAIGMTCVIASDLIEFSGVRADRIILDEVDTELLEIDRAEVSFVAFDRPVQGPEPGEMAITQSYESPESSVAESILQIMPPSTGSNDEAEARPLCVDQDETSLRQSENEPTGRYNIIDLNNSSFDSLYLSGDIGSAILMSAFRAKHVSFSGTRAAFDPGSVWMMRNASIGTITLPRNTLRPIFSSEPVVYLDILGAQIASVRIHNDERDWLDSVPKEAHGLRPSSYLGQNPALSEERYSGFLHDELLPSLGLSPNDRNELNTDYRGADYAFLRRSMLDAGYPRLEREIALFQNDHYSETLPTLSRFLYRTGRSINGYGYDNGKGLVWLLGLWIFGMLWLLGARHWLQIVWTFKKLWQRIGRTQSGPIGDCPEHGPIQWTEIIFLTLDRVTPTAIIDEDFARPNRSSGRGRSSQQNGEAVFWNEWITWPLYLVRVAAFVVIVFMLGAVLDIFQ